MAHPDVADVCQELIYRAELPAVPVAVKRARQQLNTVLKEWGVSEAIASDATLILAEIFTNAVKFGGPQPVDTGPACKRRVGVVIRYLAGELVLEVSDDSPSPPVLHEPGAGAERWRGLQVVDQLSDRWGYSRLPSPGGKVVYCTISVEAA